MNNIVQKICNATALALVEKTDDLILAAVNERFGMNHTVDSIVELKGRLECVKREYDGIETYSLDGVPFFELHPMETRMEGCKLIAERKYRELR